MMASVVGSRSFSTEPRVKPGHLRSTTGNSNSPQTSFAFVLPRHSHTKLLAANSAAHGRLRLAPSEPSFLPNRPFRLCTASSRTTSFPHRGFHTGIPTMGIPLRLQAARSQKLGRSSFFRQELSLSAERSRSTRETVQPTTLLHPTQSSAVHGRAPSSCFPLPASSLPRTRCRQPVLQKCCAIYQDANQPTSDTERRIASVHFVGIGGAGLSALASLALQQGYKVSGSDLEDSEQLARLRSQGATVFVGHSHDNISVQDLPGAVVVSSAVPQGNPEVEAARTHGVPIYKRGEWLARVTKDFNLIAVAGSHGKTSTTAMLSLALNACGMDVTALVGAHVAQFPERGSVLVGQSPFFVLEADEYDGCFLHLSPRLAVITNVEWEHVDKFPNEEAVRKTFSAFASKLEPGGVLVACGDNAGSRAVAAQLAWAGDGVPGSQEPPGVVPGPPGNSRLPGADEDFAPRPAAASILGSREVVTYGLEEGNDWRAIMLAPNPQGGTDFVAVHGGAPVARVELPLPGTHNVLNVLAVLAVAHHVALWADPATSTGAAPNAPEAYQGLGKPAPRPPTSVRDLLDRQRGEGRGIPGAYRGAPAPGAGAGTKAAPVGSLQAALAPADTRQRQQQAVQAAAASLARFEGACRRFEVVGRTKGGVVLIDDYAHHPTEIRATLQAARQRFDSVPVWVVFQPHTYSRTARLLDDLAEAFSAANRVIVTEIYAAREQNPWEVSGQTLADVITGPVATYIPKLDDVVERLSWEAHAFINDQMEKAKAAPAIRWPPPPGDLVIISMGAGTVTRVCRDLYEQLPKP